MKAYSLENALRFVSCNIINAREKPNGHLRMDNTEKLVATLCKEDTRRRKQNISTTQHTNKHR